MSRSSCASFWGPFRPLFGGHTLQEVATSAFFPPWLVLAWRAVFAIFMSTTLIVYSIRGVYTYQFYSIWCHIGIAIAFTLNASASALYLFSQSPRRDNITFLAFFIFLWFQVFAIAALFLDVVFWTILFDFDGSPTFAQLSQHAVNLVFVLLDLLLSARMQFKLLYGVVFIAYTIGYLTFAWIRFAITDDWVYGFLDYTDQSAGLTVAYYFGVLLWAFVAAFIMILVSKLSRCPCVTARKKSTEAVTREEIV